MITMKRDNSLLWIITIFLCLEILLFVLIYYFFNIPVVFNLISSVAVVIVVVWLGKNKFLRLIPQEKPKSTVKWAHDDNKIGMNEKLQNVTRKMRKQIYDLHNLFEVSINLTTILEPEQLIKSSILSLIGQLRTNQAIVFLPTEKDPSIIYPIYSKGFSNRHWKNCFLSINDPVFQKFDEKMIAVDLQKIEKELLNKQWLKLIKSGIILIAPIIPKKQIKGLIALGQKMNQELFTQSEQEIFSLLTHFISVAFSNSILYQKMEQISITDGLTGLYNYRYFKKRLEDEILRAQRYNHFLSLILFDVDHFKNYNDTLGHPAGDTALKTIARILKSTIRNSDIAVRYGGEEFCVILPEEDIKDAHNFAERLRKKIEAHPFQKEEVQPGGKFTISLGVASFPENARSMRALIDKTDAALYDAKHQGRNRTCLIQQNNKK